MSAEKTEPRFDAGRRIKWLAVFVVLAAIALSAAWFVAARVIDDRLTAQIDELAQDGVIIACPGQTVGGFPFRFGVFCDTTGAEVRADQVTIDAGALRSAAQFYNPRHIIIELDGPLTIGAPGVETQIVWETARASLVAAQPTPERMSLEVRAPVISVNDNAVLSTETMVAHMRAVLSANDGDDDLDIAVRANGLDRVGPMTRQSGLPDLDFDADIRIDNGAPLLRQRSWSTQVLAGRSGEIRRVAWLLSDDQGVIISGPLSVGTNGQLSGELSVRIIDVDAVVAAIDQTAPGLRNASQIIANLPRSGAAGDEAALTVSLRSGQAFFGFIPLGTIPSLF